MLEAEGRLTRMRNLRIGCGFHWDSRLSVLLPGEVRLSANPDFPVVCSLDLEDYLSCVVGSEMNPAAPVEFLKAHAVISRSWAVGKVLGAHPASRSQEESTVSEAAWSAEIKGRPAAPPSKGHRTGDLRLVGWDDTAAHDHSRCGFHVCADDHCQRFQGLQPLSPAVAEALRQTAHMVLLAPDGSVVDARFSKCCGGRTELFSTCWQDREMPCLESRPDPWCDLRSMSPALREELLKGVLKEYDRRTPWWDWEQRVAKAEVAANLRSKFGVDIGEVASLRPLRRGPSGRIILLEVSGSRGRLELGKELWIRRLLSESHLYSSAFEVVDEGEAFHLRGRGWGHGVGLCQIGAARMAIEGADWKEILAFYYPGSTLGPMPNHGKVLTEKG